MTHLNGSGWLRSLSMSMSICATSQNIPQEPCRVLDSRFDLIAVLVPLFAETESSQNARDAEPDRINGEVAAGTDASSETQGTALRRAENVLVKRSVRVEIVCRIERLRIRESSLVVVHSPDMEWVSHDQSSLFKVAHQEFPIKIVPAEK